MLRGQDVGRAGTALGRRPDWRVWRLRRAVAVGELDVAAEVDEEASSDEVADRDPVAVRGACGVGSVICWAYRAVGHRQSRRDSVWAGCPGRSVSAVFLKSVPDVPAGGWKRGVGCGCVGLTGDWLGGAGEEVTVTLFEETLVGRGETGAPGPHRERVDVVLVTGG